MINSQPKAKSLIPTVVLHIRGLIQGVGFRPFIFQTAKDLNLNGSVHNQNNGVVVYLQGPPKTIKTFENKLATDAPAASQINEIKIKNTLSPAFHSFEISQSKSIDDSITQVCPDIAVCEECIADITRQKHRINYPFTNCTNCGPRFSIIKNIPYDRSQTSMGKFKMCDKCYKEYTDVYDRRFHAQPVACLHCGPSYTLHLRNQLVNDFAKLLPMVQNLLMNGKIIAMKGLGGFHLTCDAFNRKAIKKLRKIKVRDGKPFALMFRNIETLKKYAIVSSQEEAIVTSWIRPIVLLQNKDLNSFPAEIANKLKTLGALLPYLPFHYQLFDDFDTDALVMTSANTSNCPIIIDFKEAYELLADGVDAILDHNRSIINRVDDSVVQQDIDGVQVMRRSRGYSPSPVQLKFNVEGLLASGAELSNAFCIGKETQAIMSQHIGDLKNLETMRFFETSLSTMKKLFRFKIQRIVCDLHPDYLSTQFAQSQNSPLIYTQHHHAHVASVMAEYGVNEPVIGICYDGAGYGTDGKIWGSEIMLADFNGFERKYHFEYIPIPGGDMVSKEPWRSSLAYIYKAFNGEIEEHLHLFNSIAPTKLNMIIKALEKNINAPESCSAGRLFDAIAGIIKVCTTSAYHAEAPIKLENAVNPNVTDEYPISLSRIITWKSVIHSILADIKKQEHIETIAAKFHNTLAGITIKAIVSLSQSTGINRVVLTGGTFQNKYLTKKIVEQLIPYNFEILIPRKVPCNDGGIALGQLAIAAHKPV